MCSIDRYFENSSLLKCRWSGEWLINQCVHSIYFPSRKIRVFPSDRLRFSAFFATLLIIHANEKRLIEGRNATLAWIHIEFCVVDASYGDVRFAIWLKSMTPLRYYKLHSLYMYTSVTEIPCCIIIFFFFCCALVMRLCAVVSFWTRRSKALATRFISDVCICECRYDDTAPARSDDHNDRQ